MGIKRKVGWAVLLLWAAVAAGGQERYALVIGNGAYKTVTPLKNATNDADDMSATLKTLGFQVELLKNATLADMEAAVVRLGDRLGRAAGSYGFFFYAGHGIQSGGVNYLVPADAAIAAESFLKTKALSAQAVLDTLQQAGNGLNVVVLDACRDNPFGWSRSGTRGLNVVSAQPPGSVVVYATSAGSVAQDGEGRNGLFTSRLLKNLPIPGVELKEAFNRTGAEVMAASGNSQVPAVYNQLFTPVYLAGAAATPQPAPSPAPAPKPVTAGTAVVPVSGRTFTPGSAAGTSDEAPGGPVTVSAFRLGRTEVTVAEFRRFVEATGYRTSAEVDGGSWVWDDDAEDWVLDETAFWRQPGLEQDDSHPVTAVSWFDAVAYCNWLSAAEGYRPVYSVGGVTDLARLPLGWNADADTVVDWDQKARGYRLPTEAEWERAAREGGAGDYAGAASADPVGWVYENAGDGTRPVAGKKANALGLFDLTGNVQEWVWDYYGSYSKTKVTDPTGPRKGTERVNRGGSWFDDEADATVWHRVHGGPAGRDYIIGFRVALSGS